MCCGSSDDESEMDFCQVTMRRNTRKPLHQRHFTLAGQAWRVQPWRRRPGQHPENPSSAERNERRRGEDRAEPGWKEKPVMVLRAFQKLKILLSATRDRSTSREVPLNFEALQNFSRKKKKPQKNPPWPARGWVCWPCCHCRKRKLSTGKILNREEFFFFLSGHLDFCYCLVGFVLKRLQTLIRMTIEGAAPFSSSDTPSLILWIQKRLSGLILRLTHSQWDRTPKAEDTRGSAGGSRVGRQTRK